MGTRQIRNTDPIEFFKKLSNQEKNLCFLHSTSKHGWETIIAFNPKATCKENLDSFIKEHNEHKLIGYFSYNYGKTQHSIKTKINDDLKLPDLNFFAFENYISFEKNTATIHFKNAKFLKKIKEITNRKINKKKEKYKSTNFIAKISASQYSNAYKKIKDYIKAGDIYQINLTHRLEAETEMPARKLFIKVLEKNPVDFLAYIEGDGFEILSASPERFVKIENRRIETCPIKGTRPRDKDPIKDEKQKEELLNSEKEKAELNMITDLLRNDIGKIAKIGSVKVTEQRLIKKCPTVWHTYSKITGEIKEEISPIEALESMLPGGSITGCPKKRAMEIIDELETTNRGIYTGVIGYIDPNQNLDFNIAIRTIIKKDKKLYLSVGGGIVIDSNEKAEFQETLDKAASFMDIL
jgi:para-aminobenzoate synthetase component 1